MPRLPNILQPKWKLFLHHHERLNTNPDPIAAQERFERRIHRSKRVGLTRTAFLVGLYFSFIAASLSFILDTLQVDVAQGVLDVLKTVSSSLTIVFIAGVFVCSRFLSYLEVELYFFSAETRLARRKPGLT